MFAPTNHINGQNFQSVQTILGNATEVICSGNVSTQTFFIPWEISTYLIENFWWFVGNFQELLLNTSYVLINCLVLLFSGLRVFKNRIDEGKVTGGIQRIVTS